MYLSGPFKHSYPNLAQLVSWSPHLKLAQPPDPCSHPLKNQASFTLHFDPHKITKMTEPLKL